MEIITFVLKSIFFTITVASSAEEATQALNEGFCPVECSFGEVSVVDELMLDHHGDLSHLPPACRQGEAAWGARRDDARFVVTGGADADAVMAIIMVAGLLDPATIQPLLSVIAQRDVSPHVDMVTACREDKQVTALLWWLQQRWASWQAAVEGMVTAVTKVLDDENAFADVLAAEVARQEAARIVWQSGIQIGDVRVLDVPENVGFGFDVWYRYTSFVVARFRKYGNITVGATDEASARRYGDRGLLDLFDDLPGAWGGRPTVGGSPRGQKMAWEDAIHAAQLLSTKVGRGCACGRPAAATLCDANDPYCG